MTDLQKEIPLHHPSSVVESVINMLNFCPENNKRKCKEDNHIKIDNIRYIITDSKINRVHEIK
jgi:hypothetical protein